MHDTHDSPWCMLCVCTPTDRHRVCSTGNGLGSIICLVHALPCQKLLQQSVAACDTVGPAAVQSVLVRVRSLKVAYKLIVFLMFVLCIMFRCLKCVQLCRSAASFWVYDAMLFGSVALLLRAAASTVVGYSATDGMCKPCTTGC